jgi:hypothetical protein
MSHQFKEGDLVEWQSPHADLKRAGPPETLHGIIISCKEEPSHLHQPGRKGVGMGTMLEVLFKGSGIEWVSGNQCRVISKIDG